jgi:hypothetical protein
MAETSGVRKSPIRKQLWPARGGGPGGNRRQRRQSAVTDFAARSHQDGKPDGGADPSPPTPPARPAKDDGPIDVPALLKAHPKIEWDGAFTYTLRRGYVPGMRVDARFFANPDLLPLVLSELRDSGGGGGGGGGGFLPAVRQLANVATLPGVVQVRCRHPPPARHLTQR